MYEILCQDCECHMGWYEADTPCSPRFTCDDCKDREEPETSSEG